MEMEIKSLKKLVEEEARQYGKFTLASGLEMNHYFDLKKILLSSGSINLVGSLILNLVAGLEVKAVGGEGLGGHLITAAVVLRSYLAGKPLRGFEITKQGIQGYFPSVGDKVVLLEDVISTGGSVFGAIKIVESNGCRVARIIAILDRGLGGSEELRKRGYDFKALFRADISGEVYIN